MAVEFASIPEPTDDPASLLETVQALKQVVEALVGRRGTDQSTAVTRQDLADEANLAFVDKPLARTNLGLGTSATLPSDTWFQVANNLSEGTAATKRSNLGLSYGKQTIWVPAGAMTGRAVNPPAPGTYTGGDWAYPVLDYDQTTGESANFYIAMPKSWDKTNLTFFPYWTASAGSGTVRWNLACGAVSNDDTLTNPGENTATSDDTLIATGDLHVGPESNAVTPANSPANDDMLALRISRDPANDTLNADARLLGVRITYIVNAGNDD